MFYFSHCPRLYATKNWDLSCSTKLPTVSGFLHHQLDVIIKASISGGYMMKENSLEISNVEVWKQLQGNPIYLYEGLGFWPSQERQIFSTLLCLTQIFASVFGTWLFQARSSGPEQEKCKVTRSSILDKLSYLERKMLEVKKTTKQKKSSMSQTPELNRYWYYFAYSSTESIAINPIGSCVLQGAPKQQPSLWKFLNNLQMFKGSSFISRVRKVLKKTIENKFEHLKQHQPLIQLSD